MYIGEISKPSVERSEIKPKPKLPLASPVEAMPPVTDKIDLSSKAKRRYQEYQKKHKNKQSNDSVSSQNDTSLASTEIDYEVLVPSHRLNHSLYAKRFEPPPNIDYSYLLMQEKQPVANAQTPTEIKKEPETDKPSLVQTHIDLNA